MLKPFVSGLLLGVFLTILGALLVGPTIIIGDQQSRIGTADHGRYDLLIDEENGATRYSILDTEEGTAAIFTEDGKRIVLNAEADTEEQ